MKKKQSYENLPVWNDSLELVKDLYILTSVFPEDEDDLFPKKLHKNAVAVPTNISKAMSSSDEQSTYFHKASLNLVEIETLLTLCGNLGFFESKDIEKIKDKTSKIDANLKGLLQKLNKK